MVQKHDPRSLPQAMPCFTGIEARQEKVLQFKMVIGMQGPKGRPEIPV